MEKINFDDYPSTNTPVDADTLNLLQDNVETELNTQSAAITSLQTHEYIVATINNVQTISTNYVVNLNTTALKKGNFTLSNKAIVIGSGINHIRVSGSIFVENWAGGSNYIWGQIRKNDSNVSSSISGNTSSYVSSSIPATIISVTNGDKITLIADSGDGGTLRTGSGNNWLCVEKID
jgi:hypothetical protein